MRNILDFLPAGQMKAKGPHEFAGPCPGCGGKDRFIVWPERPRGGAYLCRGCGGRGDGVQFLRDFMGIGYREACEALHMEPQRRAFPHAVQTRGTTSTPRAKPAPPVPPIPQATMPGKEWMQQAAAFLRSCQAGLETKPDAVLALTGRHLTPSTALACGLGWNARDRYELRSAWGLAPLPGREKMVLPAGLVIATRRTSGVVALTIRTVDPERPKYWEISGSGKNLPYVPTSLPDKPGLPVVLLESALDAALLWQEAGDLCAAVAFMGNMKGLDEDTAARIEAAPTTIACPDNDAGGHAAWQRWKTACPAAVCCPAVSQPVGAKDLGEMHKAALQGHPVPTTRQWAASALTLAMNTTTHANAA